ncbi:MAG TPA: S8 family peptidase, partial [Verrucomicrobiae bacterium]|nr:S8 family peptidase [Verrucomicrobiae bacterium]
SGLLSLRRNEPGVLRALSQEAKAAALLKWIEELKASGQFEYVEPNYIYETSATPNDARFFDGTLWGLQNYGQNGGVPGSDISATNAWDFSIGSTNVIVAVIDTGVRYTHRDLAAQMWHNPGEIPGNGTDDDNDGYVDNEFGIDAFDNDGDPLDDDGHGTHVSGTIGAAANDGNPHVGVAWKVRIMALRAGTGTGLPSTAIVECMEFAGDHGAKVINASFGGFGFSQAQFDAINALRAKGVLFVAAAGNDNNDNDLRPAYPASFRLDNIISVAAMDRRDLLASFSNFGKTTVHLGAPGVEIYSTYNGSDTDYQLLQGTSMAAPHVAGVAALVAAYLPGASYSEIRQRILDGVTKVPTLADRTITGGRLNAFRSLTRGVDGVLEFSITPANNSLLTAGEPVLVSVSISDGPPVTNATVNLSGSGTNLVLTLDRGSTNAPPSPSAGSYTNTYFVPIFPGPLSFTLTAAAPGKSNLVAQISYQAVNRPDNDKFINALKVPQQQTFTHITSNRLATIEGPIEQALHHGGAANASASIWYAWTVAQRTSVIIDTAGSTFDTVIGVYRGTTLTNLEEVIQADDIGQRKDAWVKFIAEPNISYKIAIAGVPPNDEGSVQVRFELNGEPDTVAPILQITQPVSGLTVRQRQIDVQGVAFDPRPNASGIQEGGIQYTVSTNQLRNPGELPRTAQGATNWLAPVDLAEGINFVTVWAFDNAENRSLEHQIAIIFRLPLITNDLFIDALPLTIGDNNTVTNSNENATKEFGEPPHGGNPGGKSIWYKFIPAQSGVFLVNTRGSTNMANNQPLDTVLSVYVSTNLIAPKVTTLEQLASNDDVIGAGTFSEIALTVEAGKTYYIGVDGYDAASGIVQLRYAFSPSATFPVNILPSLGNGTVSLRSGPFPANATISVVARPAAGFQFQYFEMDGSRLTQNPLTLVVNRGITVRAVFSARTFAEDFEGASFKLPFSVTNWFIAFDATNRANHVLQSPGNGLNRITNIASVVIRAASGTGGFDFGTSSETNYDRLEFYITPLEPGQATNTAFLGTWSGETRGRYEFALPAGLVRLEWRYVKDRAISGGRDLVFIDNIDVPLAAGVSALSVGNETTTVNVRGGAGQSFIIETSSDLRNWSEAGTAQANDQGDVTFVEPAKGLRRFYRFTPVLPGIP